MSLIVLFQPEDVGGAAPAEYFQSVSVTETPVATNTRITDRFRSIGITESSVASDTRSTDRFRSIGITEAPVASDSRLANRLRSDSATAAAVASESHTTGFVVSATTIMLSIVDCPKTYLEAIINRINRTNHTHKRSSMGL